MPVQLEPWTDARVETLKRLWDSGISAAEIAATMRNATRNSVLGKIHRLGLSTPYVKKVREGKPVLRKKKSSASHDKIIFRIERANTSGALRITLSITREEFVPRCAEVEPRNIPLMDLGPNDCRYPYGDGPFTFCGHPQFQRSYCASHFFLTVGAGTPGERAATKITARHLEPFA